MNVRLQIYSGGGEGGGTRQLVEPTQKTISITKIFLKQENNHCRFALKDIQQILTRCKVSKIFVFHITVELYLQRLLNVKRNTDKKLTVKCQRYFEWRKGCFESKA